MAETAYTHANTERGRHFVLYTGTVSGETTTWTKSCIFSESKQLSFNKGINTTAISRGCDTPGATPVEIKDVTSTGMTLSGSGFYRGWEAYQALREMHESVNPVLIKLEHYDAINGGATGALIGIETGTAHFILNSIDMPTDGPAALNATLEFVGMTTLADAP